MTKEGLILSLDTSDRVLGVDISLAGRSLARRVVDAPRIHASMLVPTVLELMEHVGCEPGHLDGVAVAKGPGSYTGLRIGVSSAKGMAYALGVPLLGVPTMHALAVVFRQTQPTEATALITCLTSRRNEVYAQAWDVEDSVEPVSELRAMSLDAVSGFLERAGMVDPIVAGSGSDAFVQAARADGHAAAAAPAETSQLVVSGVALLAAERFARGATDDVAHFEPMYLKDFVAKQGGSPFAAARNR